MGFQSRALDTQKSLLAQHHRARSGFVGTRKLKETGLRNQMEQWKEAKNSLSISGPLRKNALHDDPSGKFPGRNLQIVKSAIFRYTVLAFLASYAQTFQIRHCFARRGSGHCGHWRGDDYECGRAQID